MFTPNNAVAVALQTLNNLPNMPERERPKTISGIIRYFILNDDADGLKAYYDAPKSEAVIQVLMSMDTKQLEEEMGWIYAYAYSPKHSKLEIVGGE